MSIEKTIDEVWLDLEESEKSPESRYEAFLQGYHFAVEKIGGLEIENNHLKGLLRKILPVIKSLPPDAMGVKCAFHGGELDKWQRDIWVERIEAALGAE